MAGQEEAKNYLMQAARCEEKIKTMQQDRDSLREMMYSICGFPDGERVQSARDNDRLGSIYSRIDEKDRHISEEMEHLVCFKLEASEKIQMLEDRRHMAVLHKHYILGRTFQQVSDEMGYSYRYILKLHGAALKEFGRVLQGGDKDVQ